MCQTEVGVLKRTSSSSAGYVTFKKIKDERVYLKRESLQFDFFCGDTVLECSSERRSTVPECSPLDLCTTQNWNDKAYVVSHFLPWLLSSLTTLAAFATSFAGKTRDRQMLEWLKKGALSAKSPRLDQLFMRVATSGSTFDEMLDMIKKAAGINAKVIADKAFKDLLSWNPTTGNKDVITLWSDFLELYCLVPETTLVGNDGTLTRKLQAFIHQQPLLKAYSHSNWNYAFTFNSSKIGGEPKDILLSVPPLDADDINHFHLVNVITASIEDYHLMFGTGANWMSQATRTERQDRRPAGGKRPGSQFSPAGGEESAAKKNRGINAVLQPTSNANTSPDFLN